ncbi:CHC2 zinc finger domain-containing protein [Desulfotruncus arcticus]|uniref:CHC2 zinc finger domain-containing protein n=1 Tax=Desulfotruncus arcticus TaxID=341036 RepID=UPI000B80E600|nr:CHC2 zinc finger domain-containing protein [Desulfotruncus arcticus]
MLAVIRKYDLLEVNKRGSRWMACCPFHEDSYPSFVVYRDGWKCFGCGAYGDVTDFLAGILDVSPLQAARMIARDCAACTMNP